MQIEGRVGVQTLQDGAQQPPRIGHAGEIIVDDVHGRNYESVYRGGVFVASTAVAGVAPGTALSTTPPFILYNPTANTKNLAIRKTSVGYVSGTLGAGTIVYATSAQAAAPTGGTAITPKNCLLGNGASSSAFAYSGSTLSATPSIVRPSAFNFGAFLATTAAINPPLIEEVADEFLLTPGNVFVMAGVAAAGTSPLVLLSATWEEVPV
jgi:hypothetical protein